MDQTKIQLKYYSVFYISIGIVIHFISRYYFSFDLICFLKQRHSYAIWFKCQCSFYNKIFSFVVVVYFINISNVSFKLTQRSEEIIIDILVLD